MPEVIEQASAPELFSSSRMHRQLELIFGLPKKGLFEEKRYALRTIELSKLLGLEAISLEQLIALFS